MANTGPLTDAVMHDDRNVQAIQWSWDDFSVSDTGMFGTVFSSSSNRS